LRTKKKQEYKVSDGGTGRYKIHASCMPKGNNPGRVPKELGVRDVGDVHYLGFIKIARPNINIRETVKGTLSRGNAKGMGLTLCRTNIKLVFKHLLTVKSHSRWE